jgi:hypothetical protein
MTLKQVIKRLKGIALAHRQINHFFIGDFSEFLANGEVIYPACFVELNEQATISKADKLTTYPFIIHFFDLLDNSIDSNANEFEIKSDLSSIAQDYMALLNYSEYRDWDISETNQMKIAKYQLADVTAGVSISCNISTRYNSNRCQAPVTGLPTETDFNNGYYVPNIYAFTKLQIIVNGQTGSPIAGTSTYQRNVLKGALDVVDMTINKQEYYLGTDFTFDITTGTINFLSYIWNTDDIAVISFNQKINK